MRNLFLALLLLLITLLTAQAVSACSCLPRPAAQAFDQAEVVFLGRVHQVNNGLSALLPSSGRLEVRFEVINSWKSVQADEITVYTEHADGFGCGSQFSTGELWLVYARRNGPDNLLRTSMCDNTILIADERELPQDLLSRQTVAITERNFHRNRNLRIAASTTIFLILFLGVGLIWNIVRRRAA